MTGNVRMHDGEGIRAAQSRKRRIWARWAFAIIGGVITVAIMGIAQHRSGALPGHLPLAAALAAALLLPAVVLGTEAALWRSRDEIDRLVWLKANSVALYAFFLAFWVWLLLTAGGIAPPPHVLALFFGTALVQLAALGFMRMRL